MQGLPLRDFVYDEVAGTGSWIYVIDTGVEADALNVSAFPCISNKQSKSRLSSWITRNLEAS